jgi:hypothetical protein
MSEPLNEEDSKIALVQEVLKTIFEGMQIVIEAIQVQEAILVYIENQPIYNYNFGWSRHSLVELSYLNDSIIPNDKALIL